MHDKTKTLYDKMKVLSDIAGAITRLGFLLFATAFFAYHASDAAKTGQAFGFFLLSPFAIFLGILTVALFYRIFRVVFSIILESTGAMNMASLSGRFLVWLLGLSMFIYTAWLGYTISYLVLRNFDPFMFEKSAKDR